jgi:hypothetical protein
MSPTNAGGRAPLPGVPGSGPKLAKTKKKSRMGAGMFGCECVRRTEAVTEIPLRCR